jgi:Skp family chaperone for outer membrane proteins
MVLRKIFLLLFFFLFTKFSFCLEIHISGVVGPIGESSKNRTASDNIIFVDMEKVFNSHPMTMEYKKEIKNFANTRKDAIEKLIKEFNSLKENAKILNLKISQAKLANEPVDDELLKQVSDSCKLIDVKKLEISDLSDRTKNEIALMEENNTAVVLKDIESLLLEKLKKYDAAIVFDKQGVVTEKCKDVTNEVIKMVKDRK